MAASDGVKPAELLREQIEVATLDVLQAMVKAFAQALMSAGTDGICGAAYGQRKRRASQLLQPISSGPPACTTPMPPQPRR
ncbi:hypothetical protein ACFO0M_17690 [Micromonospora mangrovi]|uniref:Transposase n=2 Tax=Micromonospora TaxID=1873 RepID=A0AAU7MDI3_9ACTN